MAPSLDAQDRSSMTRNIGRQALADFFTSMLSQKAHWYNMSNPLVFDPSSAVIDRIFPPMSTLLSLEPRTMDSVLQACGLAQERKGRTIPNLNAWTDFIAEARLDVELTTFTIENKRRYFIRIGSWHKLRHPAKLPLSCWREKHAAPKLRLSALTKAFAVSVGHMNITAPHIGYESDSEESIESASIELTKEERSSNVNDEASNVEVTVEAIPTTLLPDPSKFPLLHSLGVCTTKMDRLIQEIIKFHGSETITFTRGNNREGTIVVLPSFRTLERYSAELSKRESAINAIINSIMKSTGSTEEKSAECLLNILFSQFEETFVSLCMEKDF
jgi:hypothetical protein